MPKERRRATDKIRAEWFWADRWTTSRGHTLPVGPRGVYREMLTQAWLREAKLPNNHEEICRICAFTKKEWQAHWPKVKPFWIVDGAFLVNVTQVVVYAEALEAANAKFKRAQAGGKASAQAQEERRGTGTPAVPEGHQKHAVCGRVCLHQKQFAEFVSKLGLELELAMTEVRRWAAGVLQEWTEGAKRDVVVQGSIFDFWNARWQEWQGTPPKIAKSVPPPTDAAKRYNDWSPSDCRHTPTCGHPGKCIRLTELDEMKKKAS